MIRSRFSYLFLAILVFFLFGLFILRDYENTNANPLIFFDKDKFFEATEKVDKSGNTESTNPMGGIIPHHLFASEIIADFYKKVSGVSPGTIIIIGPNHFEKGDYPVLTSKNPWDTPFGKVKADEEMVNKIVALNIAHIDNNVLENDHSAAGSMPFIKYYLPQVKVVPILLSAYMKIEDIDKLATVLTEISSEKDFFVAAVDFSHYLLTSDAKKKDLETLSLMQERNYKEISVLGSDNLDSPPSIMAIMKVMEQKGAGKLSVFKNTNSGEMQKNDFIETTSYFEIFFTKD